jgi:hypothetical protein
MLYFNIIKNTKGIITMKTIKAQILDFVESKGVATRRDIVRFYVEYIKGRTFDRIKDRNVLTIALGNPGPSYERRGYLRRPGKNDPRHLIKNGYNSYSVIKN